MSSTTSSYTISSSCRQRVVAVRVQVLGVKRLDDDVSTELGLDLFSGENHFARSDGWLVLKGNRRRRREIRDVTDRLRPTRGQNDSMGHPSHFGLRDPAHAAAVLDHAMTEDDPFFLRNLLHQVLLDLDRVPFAR